MPPPAETQTNLNPNSATARVDGPCIVARHRPDAVSHTRTARSSLAEARRMPSGAQLTAHTACKQAAACCVNRLVQGCEPICDIRNHTFYSIKNYELRPLNRWDCALIKNLVQGVGRHQVRGVGVWLAMHLVHLQGGLRANTGGLSSPANVMYARIF